MRRGCAEEKEPPLKKVLLAFAALAMASTSVAMPFSDRITLPSGEKIFLSGFNLAWSAGNFANDVGDASWNSAQEAYFRKAFKDVADSGGNVMRVWLSTDGSRDPKFGADGLVSGLGTKTIANVQKMLLLAKENKILLMPVLLTHNFLQNEAASRGASLANNKKLLTTDEGIKAYIDNAMVPLVKAIGNDPNLACWEICNECEGMVENIGWTSQKVAKANIQKITNRMAGAIKRAVPGVLVSTGIVQASYLNWYSDAALKAAGADADGTLDFYMVHYYGWNGPENSPFKKSASGWGIDKPIAVGEFASNSWSTSTTASSSMKDAEKIDTLLANLIKNGYAGGLFWQYQVDSDAWMQGFPTASPSMAELARDYPDDVKFDGVSDGKLSVVASASVGGRVVADPAGRVAPGTLVTLTAIAQPGYDFQGWAGDTTAATAVLKVTVVKDRSITAVFKPNASTNLIKNGDFANGLTSWGQWIDSAKGNGAAISVQDDAAKIVVIKSDTVNYGVQISYPGLEVEAGVSYTISFDAWASAATPIGIGVVHNGSVDQNWSLPAYFYGSAELGIASQSFTNTFEADTSDDAVVLQFNLGKNAGKTLFIDNVTLVRKGSTSIRTRVGASSRLGLRSVANGFEWTRSAPLASAATVRVIDTKGRELHRSTAKAGSVSGFVPSVGAGLRFVVLESAVERDVRPLTSTR